MLMLLAAKALIILTPEQPTEVARLAVIQKAPAFSLVDQQNRPVALTKLHGKVLLVSFIFTTCNGSCPATTHRMAKVQESLQAQAGGWDETQVQFVSITLDPARDTSEALSKYMKLYDLPQNGWRFLTGQPAEVMKTIADWGMWVKPTANSQLDHPSRVFLVDRHLRIREIYSVETLRVADVCQDINDLRTEKGP
jgi:protein SCO1